MTQGQKIVIVNPPAEVWRRETRRILPILNTLPQMGIASLAAALVREGFDCSILDAQALGMDPDEVVGWVVSHRPAVFGLTGYTSSVDMAGHIARRVKELSPDTVTVIGGPHVTAIPERTMTAFVDFDYGIVGEGELAFPLLVRAITGRSDVRGVPGLVFREGGVVKVNARPGLIDDLDTLLPPAYDLLPGFPHAYHPPIFHTPRGRAVTLVTSRGCPFHCTFCDRAIFGERYRFHSVPYIIDMIRRHKSSHGIDHFVFYDDNFTVNRRHLESLCEEILRLPFPITFACDARADLVDGDMLALMKKAGAWMISYGIETADSSLLKLLNKSLSLDQAAGAVRLTKEAGIIVKGLFMIGIPGETRESIARTKEFTRTLPFDLINLSKFTPYPGSEIYRDIEKYGTLDEQWSRMTGMNFVFIPNTVDRETLERESESVILEFYRDPKKARGMLRLLKNGKDGARLVRALWLKATGAFGKNLRGDSPDN